MRVTYRQMIEIFVHTFRRQATGHVLPLIRLKYGDSQRNKFKGKELQKNADKMVFTVQS
jgi:hypothetical protein